MNGKTMSTVEELVRALLAEMVIGFESKVVVIVWKRWEKITAKATRLWLLYSFWVSHLLAQYRSDYCEQWRRLGSVFTQSQLIFT